ncbi:serine/threonine-protein kinase [bacterium]|nr:serine/threonine-protein kinase [bacterium]
MAKDPEELSEAPTEMPEEELPLSPEQMATLTQLNPSQTLSFEAPRTETAPAGFDALASLPSRHTIQQPSGESNAMTVSKSEIPTFGGKATPPTMGPGTETAGAEGELPERLEERKPQQDRPDFVLKEVIARGGQGEIWRAWQSSLAREVAVKCLSAGEVSAFLQEAFTSGELDHPNIVPVYDLGRTAARGKEEPLLAMKLVRGTPWHHLIVADRRAADFNLDAYLARHMRILIDVCNAVAYAHAKGIIHRDLKPQQVMIGDFGEVFLMDWGLAVSIQSEVPMHSRENVPKFLSLATATNPCGTPAFMAPEQTCESPDGLGFHTDVYLLGGILYAIVAGKPPHTAPTAQGAYLQAVHNQIEELPSWCPPELSTLAFKAMATKPEDRPASARDFRLAIEEYLSGAGRRRESVEITNEIENILEGTGALIIAYERLTELEQRLVRALQLWPGNERAETMRQQVLERHAHQALYAGDLQLARTLAGAVENEEKREKLIKGVEAEEVLRLQKDRQRKLFLVASIILIILMSGSLVVVFGLRQANSRKDLERRLAAQRLEVHQERASKLAQLTALREREETLAPRLGRLAPLPDSITPSASTTLDEEALAPLFTELKELEAEHSRLAEAGYSLGPPPYQLTLAEANVLLARSKSTDEITRAYGLYRDVHDQLPALPEPLIGMGVAAARADNLTSATQLLEQAVDRTRQLRGADHPDTARALALTASAYQKLDPDADAYRTLYRQSLNILEPQWAELSLTLADQWDALGEPYRAAEYSTPTLPLYQRLYGEESPEAARAYKEVGDALNAAGRAAEAMAYFQRSLQLREELLGEQHPETVEALASVAQQLFGEGRYDLAEEEFLRLLELETELYGPDSTTVGATNHSLAQLYRFHRRPDLAEPYARRAYEIALKNHGPDHPEVADATHTLAMTLGALGRYDEAEPLEYRALAIYRATKGEDHPDIGSLYHDVAWEFFFTRGRLPEAESIWRHALHIRLKRLGPDHPDTASLYNALAIAILDQGRLAEAEPFYIRSIEAQRTAYKTDTPEMQAAFFNLGENLWRQELRKEATPIFLWSLALSREVRSHEGVFNGRVIYYLLRNLIDESLAGDRDNGRNMLILSKWLQDDAFNTPVYPPRYLAMELTSRYQGMIEALRSNDLNRPDLVVAPILRSELILQMTDAPTTHPYRLRRVDPYVEQFGLQGKVTALPEPPLEELTTDEGDFLTTAVLAWLDTVAPLPDWQKEFPGSGLTLDDLRPAGEELHEAMERVLAERKASYPPELLHPPEWMQLLHDARALALTHAYPEARAIYLQAIAAAEAAGASAEDVNAAQDELAAVP